MSRPLAGLEAEIRGLQVEGNHLQALWFTIDDRLHIIPFNDTGIAPTHGTAGKPLERPILVWKRTAGSTIADLTLSPSYLARWTWGEEHTPHELHGFVEAGHWRDC